MKIKYKQSLGILSCYNSDYEFYIRLKVTNIEDSQTFLYDPISAFTFIDNVFISLPVAEPASGYDQWVNTFIYQGCYLNIENKLFVTMVGFKHIFSSFIAIRLLEMKQKMDREHSKFLNWLLKFDFDSFVLKTCDILSTNNCKFLRKISNLDQSSFCKKNSDLVSKWRNESSKNGEPIDETDDQIDYLVRLLKSAAQELRRIVLRDSRIYLHKSQQTPLANYNPEVDWESSCPIVKIFISEVLPENDCSLQKVVFRNSILLGSQKRKNHFKPQSCYFISGVIKYLHDKQKILDFLSAMGIGVGDDPINSLEKNQIDQFNSIFWKIPDNATVMAVMDNNQSDFSTKSFKPLKDSHHVDCLNVLQVIKPAGNMDLKQDSKPMVELEPSFIDSSSIEKEAGSYLMQCFNEMLLKNAELHPTESLKEPTIQEIIPCGGDPSSLIPDFTVRFFNDDGNVLKERLMDGQKYCPYNLYDPTDPSISWDNKLGSKTSLRFLKNWQEPR